MPAAKVKEFLDSHKIRYEIIIHPEAFTAQETASSAHITGKSLAKTVMVKADGKMAMAVLPASYKVDFKLLAEAAGAGKVELAGEKEFQDKFPGCDVGAMPPFGNLYGMEVFVDETMIENREIAFNSGTHTELIKLSYKDYERLVEPNKAKFSTTV